MSTHRRRRRSPRRSTRRRSCASVMLSLVLIMMSVIFLFFFDSSINYNGIKRSLEQEHDNDDDDNHDEHTMRTTMNLTSVCIIVLLFIFLTILFEEAKDRIEHAVSQDKRIIVERLFGELTVLGFLAMVIFLLSASGVLNSISNNLVSQEEEEEGDEEHNKEMLEHMLENIHYALFTVMVFLVFQVYVLNGAAHITSKEWSDMEEEYRKKEQEQENSDRRRRSSRRRSSVIPESLPLDDQEAIQQHHQAKYYTWFAPQWLNDENDELTYERLVFTGLREEFLLERDTYYPYTPKEFEQRLTNFHFGRYLALCQIEILSDLVVVEHAVWLLFALGTVFYYLIAMLVRENWTILSWLWVAIGWATALFNAVFELHLNEQRESHLPRRLVRMLKQCSSSQQSMKSAVEMASLEAYANSNNKEALLLSDAPDPDDLPSWCVVEDQQGDEGQRVRHGVSVWKACMALPHKMLSHWMDLGGPHLYLLILQLNLVFTGVYVACLILAYIPSIWEEYDSVGVVSIVYVILAVLPVIGITYNKRRLIATLTQCLSVGPYHRKHHVIADVLREDKTYHAVRTLLFICIMQRYVDDDQSKNTTKEGGGGDNDKCSSPRNYRRAYSDEDLREAAVVFKNFAAHGWMSHADLDSFLTHMGLATTAERRQQIIQELDEDGDGRITRNEFLNWYSTHYMPSVSLGDQACDIFHLFDVDGDGEVTLSEFKNRVDALNLGFTVDEIGALLQELDRDRNGSISFEGFQHLLQKYYPPTLKERRDAASVASGGGHGINCCHL